MKVFSSGGRQKEADWPRSSSTTHSNTLQAVTLHYDTLAYTKPKYASLKTLCGSMPGWHKKKSALDRGFSENFGLKTRISIFSD